MISNIFSLQNYYFFLNYTSFFIVLSSNGLFCTTQDTIFFIFVIYTFPIFAALRAEIEVAMEIENEHLAEIPHLCMLRVRGEGTKKETKHYQSASPLGRIAVVL